VSNTFERNTPVAAVSLDFDRLYNDVRRQIHGDPRGFQISHEGVARILNGRRAV
jgi:hypothetical protein